MDGPQTWCLYSSNLIHLLDVLLTNKRFFNKGGLGMTDNKQVLVQTFMFERF